MPNLPPEGYRFATKKDDIHKLNAAGVLRELCTCGHTDLEHNDLQGQGSCRHCHCKKFTWLAYIINTT